MRILEWVARAFAGIFAIAGSALVGWNVVDRGPTVRRGFCFRIAAVSVESDRGRPEMK